jgi:hypothetical protein
MIFFAQTMEDLRFYENCQLVVVEIMRGRRSLPSRSDNLTLFCKFNMKDSVRCSKWLKTEHKIYISVREQKRENANAKK